MKRVITPPIASTLLEAMRAFGYSFEAALADLIDNSITAEATEVEVLFPPSGEPYLALMDNGMGMSQDELLVAMRHGSRNPLAALAERDLGRFGLGLKTASLSQARRLTVVTKKAGKIFGAEWDLDEVARQADWSLLELESDDLQDVPCIDSLNETTSGTLVVWRELDRALAGESDPLRALRDHIDRSRNHVALIFHRYLEGTSPEIKIKINGSQVIPLDPFLRMRPGRQVMPPETLHVQGHRVQIEAHILPHISKLTADEIGQAGGEEGLRRNQGFYVYRNRRLVVWGTWFRLARQEEMTKLARVIVDIPNSLDHLWSLDVKKSTAHPPEVIRQALRQIVDRIADRSRRVYTFRGSPSPTSDSIPAWRRIEHRGGKFQYEINRDHAAVAALRQVLSEEHGPLLERFIQMVEQSFPFDSVYADMAADRQPAPGPTGSELEESLRDAACRLLMALDGVPELRASTLERLETLEPFSRHRDIAIRIKESIK
jgi:hypothetical protein